MNENLLIVEDEFIVANDLINILENAGYKVCDVADSVETAILAIEKYNPTWVLLDIFLQDGSMGTEIAPYLERKGIGYIYISANTNPSVLEAAKATKPYGFLVKPFREKDLLIMLDIARSKHETSIRFARQRERMLTQHIQNIIESQTLRQVKLSQIPGAFQLLVPFDLMCYHYTPAAGRRHEANGFYRTGFDEYQSLQTEQLALWKETINNEIPESETTDINEVRLFTGYAFQAFTDNNNAVSRLTNLYRLNALLQYVYETAEGIVRLSFYSKNEEGFDQSHVSLLYKLSKVFGRLFNHLANYPDTLQPQTLRPAKRIQTASQLKSQTQFPGILGSSPALLQVLDNIQLVANTPVSVLIQGESGTGKEKVAYNIHALSNRNKSPFVVVNCAAIPVDLIESELFGHEKGAFTGAVEKRIGKFELANGGTIFLDEIGEMPLGSQVKLLRVLQEKQFERVGSGKTILIDTRIIAATNRNLEKEVAEGHFRLDLYYRLNVFPIFLPPLRERKEDIPILANHFLAESAQRMGKPDVPALSANAQRQLTSYNWPGNIRELENIIERTVIKSTKSIIQQLEMPAEQSSATAPVFQTIQPPKTMEQMEAEHIISVLKMCNGKVFGSGGAAEILGLPSSTLTSRIKKLGIRKNLYFEH